MSDTTITTEAPRNDAGQFASTEPAYGREGLERDAGYMPLPDESKEDAPEELTKDEAAQRLKELSGPESTIVTHTTGLPENVTLTADQAATMLAEARGADAAQAEIDGTKAAQKEIDKLRGDKPAVANASQADAEIDVDRALASPRIRDAIAERVTAADTQREAYATKVVETGTIAIAALASDFPELANRPLDQWEPVLRQMHAREPARFQQAMGRIQSVAQIQQAHSQITAEKTAREAAEFQTYARTEDARFRELTKGERNMPAVEAQIPDTLRSLGVDPAQFLKEGTESKFLRSAAAQAILVKAARYDMIMKAPKATPTRAVPTVQKPGHSGPRVNRTDVNLAALSEKLGKTGSLKDAAALLAAHRNKGR